MMLSLAVAAALVAGKVDVLVVGAGPAGIGAALASAATGARTAVVERNDVVGGTTVTAELTELGLFYAWKRQIIDGPCWTLVTNAVAQGGGRLPDFSLQDGDRNFGVGMVHVEPKVYAAVAERTLRDAGVDVRLGATAVSATRTADGWRIGCRTAKGPLEITARTVVDASGSATVAALAGARRVRSDDAVRQPGSFFFRLNTVGMKFDAEALDRAYEEAVRAGRLLATDIHIRPSQYVRQGGWWGCYIPLADDSTDELRADTNRRGEATKRRIVEFLCAQPGLEKAAVVSSAPEVGVRETYQVVGEETILARDYMSGKLYPDTVCWSFWPIDPHVAQAKGSKLVFHENGNVGSVRLGALLPKGVERMLVAGKAISSDHEANSALRVQASCMAIGQSAGVAAALAARRNVDVRQVPVADVKTALRKIGAIVP